MKNSLAIAEHHVSHLARRRCHLRGHQLTEGKREDLRKWKVKGGKVKRAAEEIEWKFKKKNVCDSVCVCRCMWMHVDSRVFGGSVCLCCGSTGPGGCWILSVRSFTWRAFFCLWAPQTVLSAGEGGKEGMVQISERRGQMGDQQREREEIKERWMQQDHMWYEHAQCCQRLSVQIQTSRGISYNKNSCLPIGRWIPSDINRQHF